MKKFVKRVFSIVVVICMIISFNITNATVYAIDGIVAPLSIAADGYMFVNISDDKYMVVYFNNLDNVVQTPNGTYVTVGRADIDIPDQYLGYANSCHDNVSSNNYRLAPATTDYNCHSYAWYSQNTETNIYWMNDPSVYYSSQDGSYVVTTTPNPGDIICYFNADGDNLHSGIVVGSSGEASNGLCGNSNMYIVESKWGAYSLYRHIGDECLYTSYAGGDATYVVYYRPNFYLNGVLHTQHTFATHNDFGNLDYHKSVCACGQTIHGVHDWYESQVGARGLDYIPTYICSNCGATALRQDIYP